MITSGIEALGFVGVIQNEPNGKPGLIAPAPAG
jgi:hypothetical protein